MITVSTEEALRDWRKLASDAAREPVKVTDDTVGSLVVLTEAEFARLKGFAWDRVYSAMDQLGKQAAASGLTEQKLDELLADEG